MGQHYCAAANASSLQVRQNVLRGNVRPALAQLFSGVTESMRLQSLPINPKPDILDELTDHTLNLFEGFTQIPTASTEHFLSFGDTNRIGRLVLCEDTQRVDANLEKLQDIFSCRLPVFWETDIALHDVGKLIAHVGHEKHSLDLINRFNLLSGIEGLDITDSRIIAAAIKNHTVLGSTLIGDQSHMILGYVLSSSEVKNLISDASGKINLSNLSIFLDSLFGMTVLDVSGYGPKGYLFNTRVECYGQICDRLMAIFSQNQANFSAALSETAKFAKSLSMFRLCGLLLQWDNNIDTNVSRLDLSRDDFGLGFYKSKIEDALSFMFRKGHFKISGWRNFIDRFHLIKNMQYADELLTEMAWSQGNADSSNIRDQDTVSPWVYKFLVLLTQAALDPEFGYPNSAIQILGQNGIPVRDKALLLKCAARLNTLLQNTERLVKEDYRIYFVSQDNQRLENSPVMRKNGEVLVVDISGLVE